eukprot:8123634-Alexandrium_andersonii.AAC.1
MCIRDRSPHLIASRPAPWAAGGAAWAQRGRVLGADVGAGAGRAKLLSGSSLGRGPPSSPPP